MVTADLTRNNNNDDTSSSGHFPDGVPVNFTTTLGTVTTTTYTRNGKASTVLRFNETLQSGTAIVTMGLDNQNWTTNVTKVPATMNITITSTGVDLYTYPYPLNLALNNIPITGSVVWVSVVCRDAGEAGADVLNVLVNGNIVLTRAFMGMNPDPVTGIYKDNLQVTISYPGGTQTKNETIYYIDGPDAGFETIQTFAIATGKVTDDMVQYWLNQKNATVNGTLLYPVGYKKAAYGTFMTALTTLWLSDKLADQMAPNTNVTWARSTPTIVMTGVSSGTGYVHCLDPAMGMSVVSDVDNTKSFRFVCSLLLSEIEQGVLGSTGVSVNSTVSGIVSGILAGESFSIIFDTENNTATLTLDNNNRFKIIIDLNTGLVKDILEDQGLQLKGAETISTAYCYHSQLTDNTGQYAQNFYDGFKESGAESLTGGLLITAGLVAFGACPPLGLILVAGGLIISADASNLFQDPTNLYNWADFGASVGLSLAGPECVTLKAAITPTFKQAMKWSVKEVGYKKTIVQGTLGGNSGEAIHTVTNNWIYGQTMSESIDQFR